MKTTYTLMDGGKITAGSPSEFLTELRKSSKFENEASDIHFMKLFAERLEIYDESKIRTESPDVFFEDLLRSGYIVK